MERDHIESTGRNAASPLTGAARTDPGSAYAACLGTITHALVGYLVTECRSLPGSDLGAALWSAACGLATVERFGRRARAARMSAAGATAVYHRYFLPPTEWALTGCEVDIEGGRIDLAWELAGSTVIFDELKLAFGRSRPRGVGPTDRQVRRYLAYGDATYGERFGGVRLLLLGAPRHSMLVGPGSQLRRLSDTSFWFGREVAMYVPTTRPNVASTRTRRNLTRSQRAAIVEPLFALQKAQGGHLQAWQIAAVARQHQRDERSIRRDLVEIRQPRPTRAPWRPPHELLVRAAMYDGNIQKAHRELLDEQEAGRIDLGLKGYWTSYRAIHADPGTQLALKKGIEKMQAFLMVGEYVSTYRNEVCYVDAYKIPVLCVDQYGRLVEDLWLVSVFEAYARFVPAHAICIGEVTGQLTADTLLAAAMGRWLTVEELAEHGIESAVPLLIGGPGDATVFDNAEANKSDVVRDTCTFVGTEPIFGRPHIAVDKAPQERWHWTLELNLQALPGYTNGARRHPADGHPSRPYAVPPLHRLPRVEAVIAAVNSMIEQYNWSHVVSTTRSAPIPRFLAEPTMLRPVDAELAWERMAPLAPRLVHPRGVKLPNPDFPSGPEFRTVTHRDFVPGRTVEVRMLHGAPGRTFFGVDGRFRAEVKPHRSLSEDEVKARGVHNAIRGRRARSVLKEAGERLVAEGLPAEIAALSQPEPTPVPAPAPRRRGERTSSANPNRRAAIRATWTNPEEGVA